MPVTIRTPTNWQAPRSGTLTTGMRVRQGDYIPIPVGDPLPEYIAQGAERAALAVEQMPPQRRQYDLITVDEHTPVDANSWSQLTPPRTGYSLSAREEFSNQIHSLPAYTSLAGACAKCQTTMASSKYVEHYPEYILDGVRRPALGSMRRTCVCCGYAWAERPMDV